MSVTTTAGTALSRQQASQMPALLEFYSPTAAVIAETPRGAARYVVWSVLAMVAALGTAMAVVPIDKVVTTQGRVVVTDSSIVVQPLEISIVRAINVHEGQVVHAGEVLARLDPTFTQSDKTSMTLQVESLSAEVERLKAEAAGVDYRPSVTNPASMVQQAIFAQRHEERVLKHQNYQEKIAGLQAQLMKAAGDIQSYGERLQVAATVEQKRRELEKLGWGSQLNRLQAQDQSLEMKRSLENAQQSARSAAGDLAAMKAEAAGDERDWQAKISQDLTDSTRKLIDAQANVEKANLRNRLVELRAPTDATVLTMAQVSVGSVMQAGEKFITLVPRDAPMELETSLTGAESGFVHIGDPVTIKFDTFPFTQYGGATGQVTSISPDSFTNQTDDRTRAGVVSTGQATTATSYYRMNVSLDHIDLHDTPKGFHVRPGMPITADVMVGKRTMLTYIMSRALPVFMDGMREP
jgi:HlyD family type I secretion membrane fusion protein